jgi:hypothetical protein
MLTVVLGMLLVVPGALTDAQTLQPVALHVTTIGAPSITLDQTTPESNGTSTSLLLAPPRTSWWTPLASLVVPGSGQFLMQQQRGVGYLVVESYLLIQAAAAQRSGNRDRSAYRSVASEVARAPFGGARPNGPWPYYEAMESFLESGRFDAIVGGAVQPENDETTFNGAQWLLARETYWNNPDEPPAEGSPEYQRALEFYQKRAVRDEFRWSWRDAQLQQDVYRQHIASANRNYQRAINLAGAVAANHLLSMVDAYVTVRLRKIGKSSGNPGGPGFSSSVRIVDTPFGATLHHTAGVSVPLPRLGRR